MNKDLASILLAGAISIASPVYGGMKAKSITFGILNTIDYVTTIECIKRGGIEGELNPLVKQIGIENLANLKILTTGTILYLANTAPPEDKKLAEDLMDYANILYGLICLNNISVSYRF